MKQTDSKDISIFSLTCHSNHKIISNLCYFWLLRKISNRPLCAVWDDEASGMKHSKLGVASKKMRTCHLEHWDFLIIFTYKKTYSLGFPVRIHVCYVQYCWFCVPYLTLALKKFLTYYNRWYMCEPKRFWVVKIKKLCNRTASSLWVVNEYYAIWMIEKHSRGMSYFLVSRFLSGSWSMPEVTFSFASKD